RAPTTVASRNRRFMGFLPPRRLRRCLGSPFHPMLSGPVDQDPFDPPLAAAGRVCVAGITLVPGAPAGMAQPDPGAAGKEDAGGRDSGPGAGAPSAGAPTGLDPWAPSLARRIVHPPADTVMARVSQSWAPSLARRISQPPPSAR